MSERTVDIQQRLALIKAIDKALCWDKAAWGYIYPTLIEDMADAAMLVLSVNLRASNYTVAEHGWVPAPPHKRE